MTATINICYDVGFALCVCRFSLRVINLCWVMKTHILWAVTSYWGVQTLALHPPISPFLPFCWNKAYQPRTLSEMASEPEMLRRDLCPSILSSHIFWPHTCGWLLVASKLRLPLLNTNPSMSSTLPSMQTRCCYMKTRGRRSGTTLGHPPLRNSSLTMRRKLGMTDCILCLE